MYLESVCVICAICVRLCEVCVGALSFLILAFFRLHSLCLCKLVSFCASLECYAVILYGPLCITCHRFESLAG